MSRPFERPACRPFRFTAKALLFFPDSNRIQELLTSGIFLKSLLRSLVNRINLASFSVSLPDSSPDSGPTWDRLPVIGAEIVRAQMLNGILELRSRSVHRKHLQQINMNSVPKSLDTKSVVVSFDVGKLWLCNIRHG